MPSDPPLHVALGPDLRRPSVRLLKVIRTSQNEEVAITQESSATCHSCLLHSTPRKVHLVKKAPVLAMGEGHVCSCMLFMHTLLT